MPGSLIRISVDGHLLSATEGQRLIDLLNREKSVIPQICYHQSLGPLQTCDTCMVEVDGELERACATLARDGMDVRTGTDRANLARQEAIHRILGNHDLYCTICDFNNGNCEVHNATALVQIRHQKYEYTKKPYAVDKSNPFYQYDPDQCILCGRCVEACQNVQVTETLSIDWSAERPRVQWDGGKEINHSSCVSCGHCVTVCPCNALMEKSMIGEAGHFTDIPDALRSDSIELVKYVEQFTGYAPLFLTSDIEAAMREPSVKRTKTVCTYCGVGCAFDIWHRDRKILKVEPNPDAPANGISTCIKGKFAWSFVNAEDRLTKPIVRENGKFQEASWDAALTRVATRLREIVDRHGPDSVAFISSSKTTNEECYLVQKLARAVFGTNNIDNCARYCQSPATKALNRTVGMGGDAGTFADIQAADLVLIVGSHTATSHPVLAAKIKRQHKLHDQRLIVADLMEHEMAQRADIFLRPKQGTDLVWINAVARWILDQGLHDREFIAQRVNGFDDYANSLQPFTLDYAERTTGIPADTLIKVAQEIANSERVCALWAMGLTQRVNGTDTCTALSNLLLLTGNYGKPGTGGYPLRGHNNVQGSCDFGALYDFLPGYDKVTDDAARARFAEAWGVDSLPAEPGLNNKTMLDAVYEGRLKAIYVIGEELALVDANLSHIQGALQRLEFFVVQDIFFSTTAEFADVVLPATPSLEKEGTFVNTERRIQRLYQVMEPLGDARPDWRILTDLAARLGHPWSYQSPEDIMNEIAACTPLFAGVTYERLEGYRSLCWPVHPDGRDTPLLYTDEFAFPDGKANFHPVEFHPPQIQADAEYPIELDNGRVLEHFHEGNMTYRCPGTEQKIRDAFLEVSPELAKARDLQDGDWVQLTSEHGTLKTRIVIRDEVAGNTAFMPVCSSQERVNVLTSSNADPVVDTPAYKEAAIKLEKLGQRGPSPIPSTNPLYGHPTPQRGVEVERKWKREDYRSPAEPRPPGGKI